MPGKANVGKLRKLAFYFSITVMLTGLFVSRALLSSGMILFAAISLIHRNLLQQVRVFFSSPFLWSMGLLFVLPFISGLWSENHSQWFQILRIKLPLLLLPVCFAGETNFKFKDWKNISFIFLALVLGGICTSLWQYFQNIHEVNKAYLKAYTIGTPLGNDHVRFSLLVVIALFTVIFLLAKNGQILAKPARGLLSLFAVITFIYLHVLAVRTGLVCFYLGVFVLLLWMLSRPKKKNLFLLLLVFFLPVAAYFIFPTFRNKVSYLKYDLSFVQKNIYMPGSSDGNRVASIRAGWELLKQQPLNGVGFGDINDEAEKFYERDYSQMSANDKILPSSEWLMYAAGVGWPGIIFFSFVMGMPFFVTSLRKNIFWILLNIFIALSYLFDIGLEVQYGVFIHAFVLLWWYKWLRLKE